MAEGEMSAARARRLEWVAAGVAGAMVLGVVAHLAVEALGTRAPAELAVSLRQEQPGLVAFTVTNRGGRGASAVSMAVALPGEPPRRIAIDYVPAGSEATGGVPVPAGVMPRAWIEGWVDP